MKRHVFGQRPLKEHRNIALEEETWKRLKDYCAVNGYKMRFVTNKVISKWLDNMEKRASKPLPHPLPEED